mgnify:FL=1
MLELCVIVLFGYIALTLLYIVYVLMGKISEVYQMKESLEFDVERMEEQPYGSHHPVTGYWYDHYERNVYPHMLIQAKKDCAKFDEVFQSFPFKYFVK